MKQQFTNVTWHPLDSNAKRIADEMECPFEANKEYFYTADFIQLEKQIKEELSALLQQRFELATGINLQKVLSKPVIDYWGDDIGDFFSDATKGMFFACEDDPHTGEINEIAIASRQVLEKLGIAP